MTARALYDFQPSAEVELELEKGDIVVIRRDVDEGWFEGELNGKRGLFPKSYVTVITELEEACDQGGFVKLKQHPAVAALSDSASPLTPTSSKKVFMETLLMPTHSTAEHIYDAKKANELFVADHSEVHIAAGPQWNHRPLLLTITVRDCQKGLRASGAARQQSIFEISTKELKSKVQRKFKHFLWLYDKLADWFPCISLPPIPIKQSSTGGEAGVAGSRRRGLERFLNRLAKHPVLGSTKILYDFLTAVDDKEWKIGKHHSGTKIGGKNSRKLFSAPVYNVVHYPPYNVPLNQLASIEKFSQFSEVMETNFGAVTRCCERLKWMHEESASCLKSLGRGIQQLSSGSYGVPLVAPASASSKSMKGSGNTAALPGSPQASSHLARQPMATVADKDSDDDFDGEGVSDWNWRDDDKFAVLMALVHDTGSRIRGCARLHTQHCSVLEENIVEVLDEYSGVIHTLPVLVRLHEEAMATYNESKQKDSKKDAEKVRQDCETLNNILLSEFDYFSESMLDDLETMMLSLLKCQADHYQKLATEWQALHASFLEKRPGRMASLNRVPNGGKKSGQLFSNSSKDGTELARPASDGDSSPKIPRPPKSSTNPYVNLSSSSPFPVKRRTTDFTEHTYANLPSLSQRSAAMTITNTGNRYENWKPLKGHSPSHASLKEYTPPAQDLPPINSVVPPPLILTRQGADVDDETQQDGPGSTSPSLPSLPYMQVQIVGSQTNESERVQSLEDDSFIERMGSPDPNPQDLSSGTQSPEPVSSERTLSSPVEDSPRRKKKPVPLPRQPSATLTSDKRSPPSTDLPVDSFAEETSDEVVDMVVSKSPPSSLDPVVQNSSHPFDSMSHPPLAKKPSPVNSFQVEPKARKSLPFQPPPVKMKLKGAKSLSKAPVVQEHSGGSTSPTELMRKLTQRRLRLEKQINNPNNSNANNNWTGQQDNFSEGSRDSSGSNRSEIVVRYHTSSREDSDSVLPKNGIVEGKSGGRYIV